MITQQVLGLMLQVNEAWFLGKRSDHHGSAGSFALGYPHPCRKNIAALTYELILSPLGCWSPNGTGRSFGIG
jgi:hypothetical protein